MSEVPATRKPGKARRTQSSLAVKTLHDLIPQLAPDISETMYDNSSSNPESPKDKATKSSKLSPKQTQNRRNNSSSSSEKISDSPNLNETDLIKKPTKPTFLHSRESSLSDGPKGSPLLKLRTSGFEKGSRIDSHLAVPESSSGSEQDGQQGGKKGLGKRSLRKTKSRGKGKGPDSLEPGLVLDEMEGEDWDSYRTDDLKMDMSEQTDNIEHVVTADIHYKAD